MAAESEGPVQWDTNAVLDWIKSFADSKEEIRQKIINVVWENDLDGHALKQLWGDNEELHELFPVLKERLTFKAMMRQLFGSKPQSPSNQPTKPPGNGGSKIVANPQSPAPSSQISTTNINPTPPPYIEVDKNVQCNQSQPTLPAISSFVATPSTMSPGSMQSSPVVPTSIQHGSNVIQSSSGSYYLMEGGIPPHQAGLSHGVTPSVNDMMRTMFPTGVLPDGNYAPPISTTQTPIFPGQMATSQIVNRPPMSPSIQRSPISPSLQRGPYAEHALPHGAYVSTTAPIAKSSIDTTTRFASPGTHSNRHSMVPHHRLVGHRSSTPRTYSSRIKIHDPEWTVNSRRAITSSKAQEITQKYRKILQRVHCISGREKQPIPYPAPVPKFTPILQQQIDRGNLLSFKTRFVYECAQFYMTINPTPSHSEYRNISMTIVAKFPSLTDPYNDREPWRKFNASLSQAIRNIRRRLRSVPGSGYPPAAPRFPPLENQHLLDISQMQRESDAAGSENFDEDQSGIDLTVNEKHITHDEVILDDDDDNDDETQVIAITVSNQSEGSPDVIEKVGTGEIKTEELNNEEDGITPIEWSN